MLSASETCAPRIVYCLLLAMSAQRFAIRFADEISLGIVLIFSVYRWVQTGKHPNVFMIFKFSSLIDQDGDPEVAYDNQKIA